MGRLLGIATRHASRAPMETHPAATVSPEAGVAGDFRGRPGERQVTVLSREGWVRACAQVGVELPWTTRRANLLVEGVELTETAGARLRIAALLLEITRETDPCARMEAQHAGLQRALTPDWRGGVCCRVVEGGSICVGDPVVLER